MDNQTNKIPAYQGDSIIIECKECRHPFYFTRGEQEFYEKHKIPHPKRCPMCRKKQEPNRGIDPHKNTSKLENGGDNANTRENNQRSENRNNR